MRKCENITYVPAEVLFDTMEQMLLEGYDAEFTVTGNSMWPFLSHNRDRVVLRHCAPGELKRGEIVLYCPTPGHFRLHRIDAVRKDRFRLVGDGNCSIDGYFEAACVIGRVVRFTRKNKCVDTDQFTYRFLSWLWMLLYPVRPWILRILRVLVKWKKQVTKGGN